jgi:hypothetical protein
VISDSASRKKHTYSGHPDLDPSEKLNSFWEKLILLKNIPQQNDRESAFLAYPALSLRL